MTDDFDIDPVAQQREFQKTLAQDSLDFDKFLATTPEEAPERVDRSFWDGLKESFKRGQKQQVNARLMSAAADGMIDDNLARTARRSFEMLERNDPVQAERYMDEQLTTFQRLAANLDAEGVKGALQGTARVVGQMVEGQVKGALNAAGLGAALMIPTGGASLGIALKTGAVLESWRQGRGDLYYDLTEKGADPKKAATVSAIAAVPYALLDLLQLEALAGFSPIKKKLTAAAAKLAGSEVIAKAAGVAAKAPIAKGVAKQVGGLAFDAAEQIGQEGLQASVIAVGEEIGRELSDLPTDDLPGPAKAAWDEMKGAFGPMLILSTLGRVPGALSAVTRKKLEEMVPPNATAAAESIPPATPVSPVAGSSTAAPSAVTPPGIGETPTAVEEEADAVEVTPAALPPPPAAEPAAVAVPEPAAVPPVAAPAQVAEPVAAATEVPSAPPAEPVVQVTTPPAAPVVAESEPPTKAALPAPLSKSAPRYGYRNRNFKLKFDSDLDRAVYIVTNKNGVKGDADPKFIAWLESQGYDTDRIAKEGVRLRKKLNAMAASAPGEQDILLVDAEPTGKESAPPAPSASTPVQPEPVAPVVTAALPLPVSTEKPKMSTAKAPPQPSIEEMQKLKARWEATGRLAFIYPKKKTVSLNGGGAISFAEAKAQMLRLLDKPPEAIQPEPPAAPPVKESVTTAPAPAPPAAAAPEPVAPSQALSLEERGKLLARAKDKHGAAYANRLSRNLASLIARVPSGQTIVEYRTNGIMAKDATGQSVFHAFAGTDGKDWRLVLGEPEAPVTPVAPAAPKAAEPVVAPAMEPLPPVPLPPAKLGVAPIVSAMAGAALDAVDAKRASISNVKQEPYADATGKAPVAFTFEMQGKKYRGELKGRNRDLLLGMGAEQDKGIALRAFLDEDATEIAPTEALVPHGIDDQLTALEKIADIADAKEALAALDALTAAAAVDPQMNAEHRAALAMGIKAQRELREEQLAGKAKPKAKRKNGAKALDGSMGAPVAKPITVEAAEAALARAEGKYAALTAPGGKVLVVNQPSVPWVGRFVVGDDGKWTIEMNAAKLGSEQALFDHLEHELAHLVTDSGGLSQVLPMVSAKEVLEIRSTMAALGYKPNDVNAAWQSDSEDAVEIRARMVEHLKNQWKDRAWFTKLVGTVMRVAYQHGFRLTRLAAESIAARSIINATSPGGVSKYGGPMAPRLSAASDAPVTPAMDAEYLAAVEAGDMDTAQRMVDDAAKAAGYDIEAWHGTTATVAPEGKTIPGNEAARAELREMAKRFGIPDAGWNDVAAILERLFRAESGEQMVVTAQDAVRARQLTAEARGKYIPAPETMAFQVFNLPAGKTELGVHLGTEQQAEARGTPFPFHVKIENPIRLPDLATWEHQYVAPELRKRGVPISESEYTAIADSANPNQSLRDLLLSRGIDGVVYKNVAEGEGDSYIAFDPSQIKSAEPVTRDNAGAVIPLSERFNDASPDVRYSLAPSVPLTGKQVVKLTTAQDIRAAVMGGTGFQFGGNYSTNPVKSLAFRIVQEVSNLGIHGEIRRLEPRQRNAVIADSREGQRYASDIGKQADAAAKAIGSVPSKLRKELYLVLVNQLDPLSVTGAADPLVDKAINAVLDARQRLDAIATEMQTKGWLDPQLNDVFEQNKGKWVLRAYRKFTEPGWWPAPAVIQAAKNLLQDELLRRVRTLQQGAANMAAIPQIAAEFRKFSDTLMPGSNATVQDKQAAHDALYEAAMGYYKNDADLANQAMDTMRALAAAIAGIVETMPSILSVAPTTSPTDPVVFQVDPLTLETHLNWQIKMLLDKDVKAINQAGVSRAFKTLRLSLIKKKDIAPEIRALYGEITDVAQVVQQSLNRLAVMQTKYTMQRELMAHDNGLAPADPRRIFSPEPTEEYTQILISDKNKMPDGKTPKPQSLMDKTMGTTYGPLEGQYVRQMDYEALQAIHNPEKPTGTLARIMIGVSATARGAKVMLSPMSWANMLVGNMMVYAADGEWRNPEIAMKAAWKTLATMKDRTEAGAQARDELVRAGVLQGSVRAEEFESMFREAFNMRTDNMDPAQFWRKIGAWAMANLVGRTGKAMGAWESLPKIASYYAKLDRGLDPQEAARQVASVFPQPSLHPPLAKRLRYNPFTPDFVGFHFESIRSAINVWREAVGALQRGDTSEGLARMAGAAVVQATALSIGAAGYTALYTAVKSLLVDDDDEPLDAAQVGALKEMLPEYMTNQQLLVWRDPKTGEYLVMNLGPMDPYAGFTSVLTAMTSGTDARTTANNVARAVFGPLIGLNMATDTAIGVFTGEDPDTGKTVWRESDGWKIPFLMAGFFGSKVAPSWVRAARRQAEIAATGGDSLISGATGTAETRGDVMRRALLPGAIRTYNAQTVLRHAFSEAMDDVNAVRRAVGTMEGKVGRGESGGTVLQDAVEQLGITEANVSAKMLAPVIRAARALGMDDTDIARAMVGAAVPKTEVAGILDRNGEILPYGEMTPVDQLRYNQMLKDMQERLNIIDVLTAVEIGATRQEVEALK